jgi:small GTP-binding protein
MKGMTWVASLKTIKRSGKVCIVGEGGVGKTSLVRVLTHGMALEQAKDTIIERTPYINIDVFVSPNDYKMQVYDLSGQRFSAHPIEVLRNQVMRNLDVMLFMFATNNFNSLVNLTSWFNDAINFMNSNEIHVPPFVLIGNKVDLVDTREVPPEMPRKIVEQRNQFTQFIEVSAYTGEGINELIEIINNCIND